MKYISILIGAIISIFSIINIGRYIFEYHSLADYGKGYIWGNFILLIIGLFLIFLGLKRKKTRP